MLLPLLAMSPTFAADRVLNGTFDETWDGAAPSRVRIDVVCGQVRTRGREGPGVRLVGTQQPDGRLEVERLGSHLHIVMRQIRMGDDTAACTDLTLELPAGVRLAVDTVSADVTLAGSTRRASAHTVSGDITAEAELLEAELETVSGAIRSGTVTELRAQSVSGSITARGVRERLEAETVSGAMSFTGTPTRGEIATVSGDVELLAAFERPGELAVTSHSGNVGLLVPPDTDATFALETFSGSLQVDGRAVARHSDGPGHTHRFTKGRGATMIELTTFSGDVVVGIR